MNSVYSIFVFVHFPQNQILFQHLTHFQNPNIFGIWLNLTILGYRKNAIINHLQYIKKDSNVSPEDFEFDSLPNDMDHFGPILLEAMDRLPILNDIGIKTYFNGPESFTPDNRYILGEAPDLKNFFVAAGFNSIGVSDFSSRFIESSRVSQEKSRGRMKKRMAYFFRVSTSTFLQ